MPSARRRSPDATRPLPHPRQRRLLAVTLAVLALVASAVATSATARTTVQAPDVTTARGVASQVGQPAPEFAVTTLVGLSLTSADLQAQEKPYILYFFASW